jgi:hypothetical protein
MEPEKEETLGYAHKVIGSIAFAFLLLQVRVLNKTHSCCSQHCLQFNSITMEAPHIG